MICMFRGKLAVFRDGSQIVQRTDEAGTLPLKNDGDQVLQALEVIGDLSVDRGDVLDLVSIQLLEGGLTRLLEACSVGTAIWEP